MAERTKIWIADTMRKLLSTKSLDKIRVTEICRAAEIERPTFYYHFQDKYDLMAWIFCQRTLNTDVLSVDSAADAMNSMRQDFIYFKRAYEDNSQNPMWAYMHEYFVKRYTESAREISGIEPDAQTQFSIRLYCYGTLGMTREWLLNDNITPARTVVEMMFSSMPNSLRSIFF